MSAGRCTCLTYHNCVEPRAPRAVCTRIPLGQSLEPQGRGLQTILVQGSGDQRHRHCLGCSYGGRNAKEKADCGPTPARRSPRHCEVAA